MEGIGCTADRRAERGTSELGNPDVSFHRGLKGQWGVLQSLGTGADGESQTPEEVLSPRRST